MMPNLNIGKPKEKNNNKLILVFFLILLSQLPAFNRFLDSGEIMALFSPILIIPLLSHLAYKQWSNEYKYSKIKTENQILHIRMGADLEKYHFHEIRKLKIKNYFGLNVMVLRAFEQTHWYFVSGFLPNELVMLKAFIEQFNSKE